MEVDLQEHIAGRNRALLLSGLGSTEVPLPPSKWLMEAVAPPINLPHQSKAASDVSSDSPQISVPEEYSARLCVGYAHFDARPQDHLACLVYSYH